MLVCASAALSVDCAGLSCVCLCVCGYAPISKCGVSLMRGNAITGSSRVCVRLPRVVVFDAGDDDAARFARSAGDTGSQTERVCVRVSLPEMMHFL